jgi:hypothetical protein
VETLVFVVIILLFIANSLLALILILTRDTKNLTANTNQKKNQTYRKRKKKDDTPTEHVIQPYPADFIRFEEKKKGKKVGDRYGFID